MLHKGHNLLLRSLPSEATLIDPLSRGVHAITRMATKASDWGHTVLDKSLIQPVVLSLARTLQNDKVL